MTNLFVRITVNIKQKPPLPFGNRGFKKRFHFLAVCPKVESGNRVKVNRSIPQMDSKWIYGLFGSHQYNKLLVPGFRILCPFNKTITQFREFDLFFTVAFQIVIIGESFQVDQRKKAVNRF